MNFWIFAAVSLLLSLSAVNASEPTRSEMPAPAPTKGGSHPWTDKERVRVFSADVGRALFRRWGEEKFKSLNALFCTVEIGKDGKILGFKQKRPSANHAANTLFAELLNGLDCNTRALGPLDSATLEIELQTYPNAIIKQSSEGLIH